MYFTHITETKCLEISKAVVSYGLEWTCLRLLRMKYRRALRRPIRVLVPLMHSREGFLLF